MFGKLSNDNGNIALDDTKKTGLGGEEGIVFVKPYFISEF